MTRLATIRSTQRLLLFFFAILPLFVSTVQAQSSKTPIMENVREYYSVVGLGSSEGDTLLPYPFPMAVLTLKDTNLYRIRLRFPNLGILSTVEDTIIRPNFRFDDSTYGYRPSEALYHFSVPVTPYVVYVDVLDKSSRGILDTRPLAYQMNVQKFTASRIDHVYDPESGLGNPLLRRRFTPKLLPFTFEVNPGWRGREQFDTSGTYSLIFSHPENANDVKLSLSMRAASISELDSASWADFKLKARQAFGDQGAATNTIGDFVVDDVRTRSLLRAGFEMLAKRNSGGVDYIAALLTPKTVILLMAPLTSAPSPEYDYIRSIVRSFRLE